MIDFALALAAILLLIGLAFLFVGVGGLIEERIERRRDPHAWKRDHVGSKP